MSIKATCRCGAQFMAIPELAGKVVNCPTCGQSFQVPRPVPAGMFTVVCRCGKRYQVKREMAGQGVQCQSCGGQFVIPQPPGAALAAPQLTSPLGDPWSGGGPLDNLGSLSFGDPLSNPLNNLPTSFPAPSAYSFPGHTFPGGAYGMATPARRRKFKWPAKLNKSVLVSAGLGLLVCLAIVGIGIAGYVWAPHLPLRLPFFSGYSSPEAAFEAQRRAQMARDWGGLYNVLTPDSRERLVGALAAMVQFMPDHDQEFAAILTKYGVPEESAAVKPPSSPADFAQFARNLQERARQTAAAIGDKEGFFVETMAYFEKKGDELKMRSPLRAEHFAELAKSAELRDLVVDGDTARGKQVAQADGQTHNSTILFRKVDGRWYIEMPDFGGPL